MLFNWINSSPFCLFASMGIHVYSSKQIFPSFFLLLIWKITFLMRCRLPRTIHGLPNNVLANQDINKEDQLCSHSYTFPLPKATQQERRSWQNRGPQSWMFYESKEFLGKKNLTDSICCTWQQQPRMDSSPARFIAYDSKPHSWRCRSWRVSGRKDWNPVHQVWESRVAGCRPSDEYRSIICMFSLFLAFHCLEPVNKEKNYKGAATDNHLLEEEGIQQEEFLSWLWE